MSQDPRGGRLFYIERNYLIILSDLDYGDEIAKTNVRMSFEILISGKDESIIFPKFFLSPPLLIR